MFSYRNIFNNIIQLEGKNLSSDLNLSLLEDGGVYIWRRVLQADPEAVVNLDYFQEWLSNALAVPYMKSDGLTIRSETVYNEVTIRNDFIKIDGIVVGKGDISEKKKEYMKGLTASGSRQSLMLLLSQIMSVFGPVLYVGETNSFSTRFKSHLGDNSSLRRRLDDIGVDISNTNVTLLPMPSASTDDRKFLEQILTYLLMAPLTMRAG